MSRFPVDHTVSPSRLSGQASRSSRTAWAAYAACALALLSAVPSFYWAAGGTVGLDTVGGAIEQLARSRDPAGVAVGVGAGVLKVAGGLLALALVRPWGRLAPRRLLLGIAWAASAVLTAYGGLLVAVGTLVLTDLLQPSGPVDRTALQWHVLLWDLWFLVWGLLLGFATWHTVAKPRNGGADEPHSAPVQRVEHVTKGARTWSSWSGHPDTRAPTSIPPAFGYGLNGWPMASTRSWPTHHRGTTPE